jgi:hypothetical protein
MRGKEACDDTEKPWPEGGAAAELPSEIDQASPLRRSKSARLDNEIVAADSNSDPNAS